MMKTIFFYQTVLKSKKINFLTVRRKAKNATYFGIMLWQEINRFSFFIVLESVSNRSRNEPSRLDSNGVPRSSSGSNICLNSYFHQSRVGTGTDSKFLEPNKKIYLKHCFVIVAFWLFTQTVILLYRKVCSTFTIHKKLSLQHIKAKDEIKQLKYMYCKISSPLLLCYWQCCGSGTDTFSMVYTVSNVF
jgi:hypothetical protein